MNLPDTVHINGKGNICYTYDAGGNKLQKVTLDNTNSRSTATLYLDGFVYQQTSAITTPGQGVDTLQFMAHEEGRARWAFHKYLGNAGTGYGWEYDFFEKDHLGNTRVVLSQQKDTANYGATMEAVNRNTENALFYNIPATSCPRTAAPGYPAPASGTVNDSVARLNGSAGSQKTGPAIILKVMSGDKVDIGVNYYYNSPGAMNGQSVSVSDIINSLASGIVSATGPSHGSAALLSGGTSPLNAALSSYLTNPSNNPTTPGKPNAYLNWILLDNQFTYVSGYPQSGALQVGAAGTQTGGSLQLPLTQTGIPITKSGYLYIYVSNATPGWDVFFDNLSVTTYAGPMLEENHYYPFGLTMAGISDKALKTNYSENKYKYNGIEYDSTFGLDEYEAHFRDLDPQTGRWWQIDPDIEAGTENLSPYASMSNDPVFRTDPLGNADEACCSGLWQATKDLAVGLYNTAVIDARVFNTYVNPLTPFVEGATGKSVESDFSEDKPRLQSAADVAIVLAGGKIEEGVLKAGGKILEKVGEQTAEKTAGKAATKLEGKITEPKLPAKTIAKEGEVEIVHYSKSGDHAPAHLHVKGGGAETRIGQNGRPLRGSANLTSTQEAAVNANKAEIRKSVKQIMKWHKYNSQ